MLTDQQWKNLVKQIEKGKCAIFLGLGVLHDGNGKTLYDSFCSQLAKDMESLISAYYPEENLFLFKLPKNRTTFAGDIEDFYRSMKPDPDLYRMLAEIPVSLYISVSPDNFLEKALGENAQVTFFKDDPGNNSMKDEADNERPLLYKIFGTIEDTESLILTHDNLFDFLKKILGEDILPAAVKTFFRENAGGEVIFLGFDFRKWYVRLLLRIFNLNKVNELNRTAYMDTAPLEDERSFAMNNFQVEFIETNVRTYVETLHAKCKEKGILRMPADSKKIAGEILAENKQQRLGELRTLLAKANTLRDDYQDKKLMSSDPKEKMQCDYSLAELEKQITSYTTELQLLKR